MSSPSTDRSGPTELSEAETPSPVATGGTVVLSASFNEPHGPISVDFEVQAAGWTCDPPVINDSAAPIYGFTVTCIAGAPITQGYEPLALVYDAFGFDTLMFWNPQVT